MYHDRRRNSLVTIRVWLLCDYGDGFFDNSRYCHGLMPDISLPDLPFKICISSAHYYLSMDLLFTSMDKYVLFGDPASTY